MEFCKEFFYWRHVFGKVKAIAQRGQERSAVRNEVANLNLLLLVLFTAVVL